MAPTIGRVLELDLWAVVVWSGFCGQEASKAVQSGRTIQGKEFIIV